MLPPSNVQKQTLTANGRQYTGVPGNSYDILDTDALILGANGWIDCGPSFATASRPVNTVSGQTAASPLALAVGLMIVDLTLNKTGFYDGAAFRDINGSAI